jgi:hypothetical protein
MLLASWKISTNVTVVGFDLMGLNPWFTTLEVSTLTITLQSITIFITHSYILNLILRTNEKLELIPHDLVLF